MQLAENERQETESREQGRNDAGTPVRSFGPTGQARRNGETEILRIKEFRDCGTWGFRNLGVGELILRRANSDR